MFRKKLSFLQDTCLVSLLRIWWLEVPGVVSASSTLVQQILCVFLCQHHDVLSLQLCARTWKTLKSEIVIPPASVLLLRIHGLTSAKISTAFFTKPEKILKCIWNQWWIMCNLSFFLLLPSILPPYNMQCSQGSKFFRILAKNPLQKVLPKHTPMQVNDSSQNLNVCGQKNVHLVLMGPAMPFLLGF